MSEALALLAVLRQSADAGCVAAIERLVARGAGLRSSAASTCSISPRRHGLDEERVIAAFLHAARLGLFELSWNVLCPGCGGVLDANATLKSVRADEYNCALCAAGIRADARRDGRGDLHRQPARAADRGARSAIRCRSGNISARSSGARASTCPRTIWRKRSQQVTLDADRAAGRARRRICRCSCRPSSLSSSSR